ncbi:MAG: hypothetical protein HQ567_17035, partial [Candidatus Nealsonbacteria bacterium]|nr:hypothetical protein [Candidatus Nealsonbacteria bacterium]
DLPLADQVIDYVRDWKERTELPSKRLATTQLVVSDIELSYNERVPNSA